MPISRLLKLALMTALLAACGQKGPLMLPEDSRPAPIANGKAVSTKPATKKQLEGKALSTKPLSTKPVNTKPIETKPVPVESMDTKPYEVE